MPSLPVCEPSPMFVSETRVHIPLFETKTPAAEALQRNHEMDHWIRQIEMQVSGDAVRIHCRGDAERVINSPLFDDFQDWTLLSVLHKSIAGQEDRTLYNLATVARHIWGIRQRA
ncbi:uncharacterized protein LOC134766364 [Penaeus indicus]|uniref:uncharacterized protein LOC134766364 n=1 Tax=Penaeus indicus TaxID=29960 RepID=UPI00300CC2AD